MVPTVPEAVATVETLRETLVALVDLQRLEDELRDLRVAKAELEAMRRDNAEALAGFDAMLAAQVERIDETKTFYAEKEQEIHETEDNTKRSRARLTHITNQRELTALNKELDAQRRQIQQRNEELLKLMEELDAAEADRQKKQDARQTLQSQMVALEAELAGRVEVREGRAAEQMKRRAEIRAVLDRQLVARFDRIAKARDGVGVADVVDGTCSGCKIQVPPQQFIRLQRMESIEQCPSCVRILVYFTGVDGLSAGGPEVAAQSAE